MDVNLRHDERERLEEGSKTKGDFGDVQDSVILIILIPYYLKFSLGFYMVGLGLRASSSPI